MHTIKNNTSILYLSPLNEPAICLPIFSESGSCLPLYLHTSLSAITYELGVYYYKGESGEIDMSKAEYYYSYSASLGDNRAKLSLANMYTKNFSEAANVEKATAILEEVISCAPEGVDRETAIQYLYKLTYGTYPTVITELYNETQVVISDPLSPENEIVINIDKSICIEKTESTTTSNLDFFLAHEIIDSNTYDTALGLLGNHTE